jgi:hypothetical protein
LFAAVLMVFATAALDALGEVIEAEEAGVPVPER